MGGVKSLIMDGVPWVVSGSLAAAAHGWPGWTGGGSDPGEIWRVERLSKDLSACPRGGGSCLRIGLLFRWG